MFRRVFESLCALILAPLLTLARSEAATQSADAVAHLFRRAQEAEDEGQTELARKLREYAGSIAIDSKTDSTLALPEPTENGHSSAPALLAPRRGPGRPRKEDSLQ